MNTKHLLFGWILAACTVLFAACTAPPMPAPTAPPATSTPPATNTPAPTNTAAPTHTPTRTPSPAATSAPVSHDGYWEGGTESNPLLSGGLTFIVADNQVTEILFNYTLQNGGCTFISAYQGTADRTSTEGNEFMAEMEGAGKVLTLNGTFTSARAANGTLQFKGTMEGCPDFDRTVSWTAQNVPFPPTQAPTETPTETPTPTPIPPTVTRAPTATAAPFGNRPELESLDAAITKSKQATVLRAQLDISMSGLYSEQANAPTDNESIFVNEQAEINGSDRHVIIKGLLAMLYGGEPENGIEYVLVDGEAYVHGPNPIMYGAPLDRWYKLKSIPPNLSTYSSRSLLESFGAASSVWAHLEKARSGESFDGVRCDVYAGGQDAASEFFERFWRGSTEPVIEEGSIQMYACEDGYLHAIRANVSAHDQADPTKHGSGSVNFHLFDFDGSIMIEPPDDALPASR